MINKVNQYLEKINVDNLVLKACLLFPITTVIQGLPYLGLVNKALVAFLTLFLLLAIVKNFSIEKYGLAASFFVSTIFGILLSDNFNNGINNLFYFLIFGLFAVYLIFNYSNFIESIEESQKAILIIVLIWTAIVGVSLFIPASYVTFKTGWGGDAYFMSFTEGSPHRLASTACFILVLVNVLLKNNPEFNKKKIGFFCLLILPLLVVLLTGARIYLIVALLTFVIIYYNVCDSKKLFWISAIPVGIAGVALIMLSPMGTKLISVFNDPYIDDLLFTFTNGRSEFWIYDLILFTKGKLFHQIFGFGVSYIFDINNILLGSQIYAHNDFINILLSYGYFGLIQYFTVIAIFIRTCKEDIKKIPFIIKVSLFLIYFTCAFLNGFYVYPCTLLSFPILLGYSTNKKVQEKNS